ncbi:MAG: hypothetical protein ABR502_05015 [Chitinophagaceae bacterium]
MNKLILIFFIFLVLVACDKDKFETKPQIKIVSVSRNVVPKGGDLRFLLKFTDKEGDVDDSLFVIRQRLNRRAPVTARPSPYGVPEFPNQTTGQIQVTLDYNLGITFAITPIRIAGTIDQNQPDTMRFKFVLKDKAGNVSDTATSDNIIVIR